MVDLSNTQAIGMISKPLQTQKTAYDSRLNRKTVPKTILPDGDVALPGDAISDDDEENPLFAKLESCTVAELRALQKQSLVFDEEKYPEDRIEVVTERLRAMERAKPLRFAARLPVLTPRLIVERFDTFFTAEPDQRNHAPLLLNITRDTPFHLSLVNWSQYEVIGDFFDYIHLALFDRSSGGGGGGQKRVVLPPDRIDTLARLQNAFIYSHHQETPFKSSALIEQLECFLYSKLIDIHVSRRTASFHFEWNASSPFVLIVCFGIVATCERGSDVTDDDAGVVTSLTRDDLFNDISTAPTESILTQRKKATKELEHQQKKQKKAALDIHKEREFLRAGKLSYLYYGYMGRD